jgi:hypothetical protein
MNAYGRGRLEQAVGSSATNAVALQRLYSLDAHTFL